MKSRKHPTTKAPAGRGGRRICAVAGSLAIAAAASACSGGSEAADTTVAPTTTEAPATTATTAPTTTVAVTTTTEVPDVPRQPLTGTPVADAADIIQRPALAVKIDNHPSARSNHAGIGVADIVFEELVEGTITRFAAVFHSQDADPVGPIRSGREQDVALLSSMNQPLFAWSGGNPGVSALVANSFLTDLNWQSYAGSYYRGPGSTPHNLYSSTERLYELTPEDHPGAPSQQFQYLRDGAEFVGEEGRDVKLDIGSINIEWVWSDDNGRYMRFQEGSEHIDQSNGQIGADNVMLLGVQYRPSSIDARSPEAITLGTGSFALFSNGQYVTGTWERDIEVYPFQFTLDSGETLELTPGQTWVELVEVENPGDAPAFTLDG